MKNRVNLLLFLASFSLAGQLQIQENFTDSNFTQNPPWQGDTARFIINDSLWLQLQDTAARSAYLSTASAISEAAQWEFSLHLDFNPSSSNYARFYLMSDQADLSGPLQGYFLRMGGSPDDRISLYRQTGQQESLLIQSAADWLDTDPVQLRVKVRRDSTGFWHLAADTSGGNSYRVIDSVYDATHRLSRHLGLRCHYTVTRADRMFFDQLLAQGRAYVDSISPRIDSFQILSAKRLLITFSESVTDSSAGDTSHYHFRKSPPPRQAIPDSTDSRQVELQLSQPLRNGDEHTLVVNGVQDPFGNGALDSISFLYRVPRPGDVVIHELMVDPSPPVGIPPHALPEWEYIELHNRSEYTQDLQGWRIEAGTSSDFLPSYKLPPDSFVVLTKEEALSDFPVSLPVVGVDIGTFALVNSGAQVQLYSDSGQLISHVAYSDTWYDDAEKSEGGWSLEQIDPENDCGGAVNWTASEDSLGGTPGRENSVARRQPDTATPRMERLALPAAGQIELHFSRPLSAGLAQKLANYQIWPNPGLDSLYVNPVRDLVRLYLSTALESGLNYQLSLDSLPRACNGRLLQRDTLVLALPEEPQAGDVVLNEVMAAVSSGGAKFIELYNLSDKVFDLRQFRLCNYDSVGDIVENCRELRAESFLFLPGQHLAFTTDPAYLQEHYHLQHPDQVLRADRLPSMPAAGGVLAVSTSSLQLLDKFHYSEDLHLPVLEDVRGISLERVSPGQDSDDPGNWQSAARQAGFATPGYRNSHYHQPRIDGDLRVEPEVFSPNGDGYHDQVKISFRFKRPNNVVNLRIHRADGTLVKNLVSNHNVGPEGFFVWDGTDEHGQLLNRGVYLLVLDYFHPNGEGRRVLKETCVLSR